MNLSGKVALITGSSRGIGKATALHMGQLGIRIAVTYHKEHEKAAEVVAQLQHEGSDAYAYQVDVANQASVHHLVTQVRKDFGGIDILVNNAGMIFRPDDWDNLDEDRISRSIDVNLKGPLYCIQAVAPLMLKQQSGRIINITSTYAMTGAAAIATYTASKAGVISLTKGFAKELAPHITVNAVAPGNVDTEMTQAAGAEFNQHIIKATPLGRLAHVNEIAEAITFLVKADFITGHTLIVDGGHMC